MAAKYKSRRQYQSRLQKQENKRLKRQTLIIILSTIGLIALIIIVGIPLMIRTAVFIGGVGESENTSQSDAIPPQTPQLSSPAEATNSSSLNLIGFSEAGATVSLFQNNQEKIKTVVDASGKFEFLSVELEEGNNSFYAVAKDSAENTSQRSLTRHVLFDTLPPEITIESPENDTQIVGVTRQTVTITGNTEAGSKVMLNGRVVVVSSDGSFSTKHSLQDGDNLLTFTASDKAGNTSTAELKLIYSKE